MVKCAARINVVAPKDAERLKEAHYHDRTSETMFVPLPLDTYGTLSFRSDPFLVECASSASRECAGLGRCRAR